MWSQTRRGAARPRRLPRTASRNGAAGAAADELGQQAEIDDLDAAVGAAFELGEPGRHGVVREQPDLEAGAGDVRADALVRPGQAVDPVPRTSDLTVEESVERGRARLDAGEAPARVRPRRGRRRRGRSAPGRCARRARSARAALRPRRVCGRSASPISLMARRQRAADGEGRLRSTPASPRPAAQAGQRRFERARSPRRRGRRWRRGCPPTAPPGLAASRVVSARPGPEARGPARPPSRRPSRAASTRRPAAGG